MRTRTCMSMLTNRDTPMELMYIEGRAPRTKACNKLGYIPAKTTDRKKLEKMTEASRVLCESTISLKQNGSSPLVLESHKCLFPRIKRLNDGLQ